MRTFTLSVCVMLIAGACLAGEHEDAARLLVQTTGEAERAAQSLKQHLLNSFEPKPDGILKRAVVDAVSALEAVDVEDLLFQIYAKHFTTEELAEMTVFARTPVGRKFLFLVYAKHFTTKELAEMTVLARTPVGRKRFFQIYTKDFTTKELAEMTVFAKTPVGRKFFRKHPILLRDGKNAVTYLAKQISRRAAKQAVEEHGEDAVRQEMQKPGASNQTGGR
jgi:hypothetical protein